jgi:glutathione S-transferase
MRLYESTLPSGNVYKVKLLLHHLGIDYETKMLDIMAQPSQTRTPEFLEKNPNGRVPVLELDGGRFLPESNAILYYLAEGSEYLPKDHFQRAQVLQWMFFEQYSHEPYIAVLKFWTYWGGLEKCLREDLARWKTRGQAALDVMARHLEGRKYFVAEKYTIADIALFAYTQSAEDIGYSMPPPVRDWLTRVAGQPRHIAIEPARPITP